MHVDGMDTSAELFATADGVTDDSLDKCCLQGARLDILPLVCTKLTKSRLFSAFRKIISLLAT